MKSQTLAQYVQRKIAYRLNVTPEPGTSLEAVRRCGFRSVNSMLALAVHRGAQLGASELPPVKDPGTKLIPMAVLIAALLSLRAPYDKRLIVAGGQLIAFLRGEDARATLVRACQANGTLPVLNRVIRPLRVEEPIPGPWRLLLKRLRAIDREGRRDESWGYHLPSVRQELRAFEQRLYPRR